MKRILPYLVGGLLVALLLGLGAWRVVEAVTRRADAAAATEVSSATPVDVIVVAPRDLVEEARVPGTLRALHEADVVADVPGRVTAVLVDVGASVKRGEVLVRLEQRDLQLGVDQAAAALAGAEAGRDTAARDLAGAQSVAQVGGVTESQLVAAKSRAAAAEAQVSQAKAALGLARARLDDATLRSPFDGVVTRRATDIGRMVSPGVPVFGIADLSSLELVIAVDERVAARLHINDTVAVESDTVPGELPAGTVKNVAPSLDASTHKAEVVISLPYAPGLVSHGTATAVFTVGRAQGVVAVPTTSLVELDGQSVVYVVDGKVARRTPVKTGIREGSWVEVTGLPEGATVVTSGNTWLTDGAAVAPRTNVPS